MDTDLQNVATGAANHEAGGEPAAVRPTSLSQNWLGLEWLERPWFAETAVGAIAALAYVATLSFGFVYDDVPQILKNPAVHSWKFLPQYFTAHVWAAIYPGTSGNYYRPVFLLWLRVNYALFGTDAAGWHFTSLACHVMATWLVFRLARQLSGDRATAFVAALIFGVHPAHIENVAWISGVTDPLMACFVLGSFSAFLDWRRSRGIGRAALALLFFALGLLSKETAVVLPGLIFAYLLIDGRDQELWSGPESGRDARLTAGGTPALRSWALLGGFAVVVLIYFGARFYALHGWSHSTIAIGWKEVLLSWPAVLWFYARHLVLPVQLSEFYSLDYVSRFTAGAVLGPLAFLLMAAVAVVLALVFIRERSEKKLARFALVFIIVPLLPVLDLRSLTAGDIVHDRYLYLPSVGFALLVALVIREFGRRSRPTGAEAPTHSGQLGGTTEVVPFPRVWTKVVPFPLRVNLAAAVVVAIGVVFAVLTVSQQMSWASDILLYTRGMESAPANLTVRDNLANALLDANQPERAIPLYLEVLGRNPAFWRSNYNLGFAYYKTGNFEGAEEYLKRAIRIDPSDPDQYIYLALAQVQLKKLTEAAENARRALALSPHARGYHSVAGLVYETEGDRARAAAELKMEVAEHPDNAAAVVALRKLQETSPAP